MMRPPSHYKSAELLANAPTVRGRMRTPLFMVATLMSGVAFAQDCSSIKSTQARLQCYDQQANRAGPSSTANLSSQSGRCQEFEKLANRFVDRFRTGTTLYMPDFQNTLSELTSTKRECGPAGTLGSMSASYDKTLEFLAASTFVFGRALAHCENVQAQANQLNLSHLPPCKWSTVTDVYAPPSVKLIQQRFPLAWQSLPDAAKNDKFVEYGALVKFWVSNLPAYQ